MKNRTYVIYTKTGAVRVEKRALDATEFLQRRKERKRAEVLRRDERAMKRARFDALFI